MKPWRPVSLFCLAEIFPWSVNTAACAEGKITLSWMFYSKKKKKMKKKGGGAANRVNVDSAIYTKKICNQSPTKKRWGHLNYGYCLLSSVCGFGLNTDQLFGTGQATDPILTALCCSWANEIGVSLLVVGGRAWSKYCFETIVTWMLHFLQKLFSFSLKWEKLGTLMHFFFDIRCGNLNLTFCCAELKLQLLQQEGQ